MIAVLSCANGDLLRLVTRTIGERRLRLSSGRNVTTPFLGDKLVTPCSDLACDARQLATHTFDFAEKIIFIFVRAFQNLSTLRIFLETRALRHLRRFAFSKIRRILSDIPRVFRGSLACRSAENCIGDDSGSAVIGNCSPDIASLGLQANSKSLPTVFNRDFPARAFVLRAGIPTRI